MPDTDLRCRMRGRPITDLVERGGHSIFVGDVTEAVQHRTAEILTLKEIGATCGG